MYQLGGGYPTLAPPQSAPLIYTFGNRHIELDEDAPRDALFQATFDNRYIPYLRMFSFLMGLAFVLMYGAGLLYLIFYWPFWCCILVGNIGRRRVWITKDYVIFKVDNAFWVGDSCRFKTVKTMLLETITDVTLSIGCLERQYGITTLKVENPGQSGQGNQRAGADMVIQGIEHADEFRNLLLELRKAARAHEPITPELLQRILTHSYIAPAAQTAFNDFGGTLPSTITGPHAESVPAAQTTNTLMDIAGTLRRIEGTIGGFIRSQYSAQPTDDRSGNDNDPLLPPAGSNAV